MLTNTKDKYGSPSKLLHWLCALGVISQFYLVYQRDYVPKKSPWNLQLILLHKSIGMCLLFLGLIFIIWHMLSTKPNLPRPMPNTLKKLAYITQGCLLLCLLIMPVSGYIMSSAGGYPIKWFGLFTWPSLLTKSKSISGNSYQLHHWCSYLLIAAFSLHTLAASKHHFIDKDNILRRMLPGKTTK